MGSMSGWLLVTTSTPGGSSTLRVWAWRRLRSLGAHYLQQSVCVLPATPATTRAVNRVLARLRDDGGHGQALSITVNDAAQEQALIDAFQRERADEYREVVERTKDFHAELTRERDRSRLTYTELEESDADLARHKRWLEAIRARDYFDAPGAAEAVAAVDACEQALADFEAEALQSELDHASRAGAAATDDEPHRSRRQRVGSARSSEAP
jgi:hypothetical protein